MEAARLVFLTDVEGVADKSGNIFAQLTSAESEQLIISGVIAGGMIPKIRACQRALNTGAITRIIDGRKPHALLREFADGSGGTTIVK